MSIPSWAYVGAKVVMVDNSPGELDGATAANPDRIFTLSELRCEGGRVGCRVAEWNYNHFEYTRLSRFRPLITQSDDISAHFQHHLSNPVREDA